MDKEQVQTELDRLHGLTIQLDHGARRLVANLRGRGRPYTALHVSEVANLAQLTGTQIQYAELANGEGR
jgi:hypothetical protein